MVKNLIEQFNKFKHWLLTSLDTVLSLLGLILVDVNSFHFGNLVGMYVVAATLILIALILNKPVKK